MEDKTDIQDFEMGSAEAPEQPKINKYTEDIKPPKTDQKPNVNPTAPAPRPPQVAQVAPRPPQVAQAAPRPPQVAQALPKQGTPVPLPTKPSGPSSAAKKKAIIGCLGAFGAIMLIFLVLSFVFLAQSGDEANPFARLLGVNQATFINGLITFIHIIFILVSLVTFIIAMAGIFKASTAKKDDIFAKKAGLRTGLISGVFFFIIIIIWFFVFIYLDAKRVQVAPTVLAPIITVPEETLELTAPIDIRFDATNVPIDKIKFQIVSHDWDFGDGESGTSQIVTHIYEEKGIYDVKLEVTVKNKKTGELSIGGEYHEIVSITNQALAAIFSADPQTGEAPLKVEFDATEAVDPDGTIDRYEWDLDGDGEFDDGEGVKLEYTFEKIGKYEVSLRVTSTTGEFAISEKEIDVVEGDEPEGVITVVDEPETYTVGMNYVFKGEESTSPAGKIVKYEWDFSDGTKTETTKTVSHSFEKGGTFEVTLKVTDEEENEGEVTKTVTVGAPKGRPKAKINTEPAIGEEALSLAGIIPFTVIFDASGTTDSDNNIVDYEWDFDGDGTGDAFGEKANNTYNKEGTYTATLTVTDSDDNVGKDTVVVKVAAQGIIANIETDKIDGNVPLTVKFDASGSTYTGGQITSYKWDFGDDTPIKIGSATISHKYTGIGAYRASVTIVGSDNTTDIAEITITVREIPLGACFVSVFEEGPAPLETSFDPGCSTGTITNYFWEFGDGGTSSSVKPTHVFEEPGEYRVTLEIADAENTVDKAELFINVTE